MSIASTKIDYSKELNKEQLDVVMHGDGPCLVLSGAGSGKTRTITYRVAYLLDQGVLPKNILLLTFTNKAAKEMLSRVEQILGYYPNGLWGGTFHSVANRLLRTFAQRVGYSAGFTIMDEEDSKTLVKMCVKSLDIDSSSKRFPSPSTLHSIISYSRNAQNTIPEVIEDRFPNFIGLSSTVERIADLYAKRKHEANSMDFDDLLLKLSEFLLVDVSACEQLSNQFQYILVDEFQDTNVVQAEIVRKLGSVNKNILVVGDDAQSIYSFRAAQVRNILNFPKTYDNAKIFRLTKNYRSTPDILAVANATIRENKNQFKKELTAACEAFEKPLLVSAGNAAQEAQYIAEQVLALRGEGMPLSEIAVLFRASFHSQALEFELMKREIPYEYRGGLKFFERAHVKDVVSFLRIKANPKDETAWMRVLGLMDGIGLASATKIVDQLRDLSSIQDALSSQINIPNRAQNGWNMLCVTLKKFINDERPSELIRFVASGDYREYLQAEYQDHIDRLEDIEQFAFFAEEYTNLKDFLDEVSLSSEYGALQKENDMEGEKMILSTIHQAKGLEWDAVFVMHLIEGKFPIGRALVEQGGLEEERRLFYVATTRAREKLFFSYPATSGYDVLLSSQPSIFITELPDDLLEHVRLKRAVVGMGRFSSDETPTIVLDNFGERVKKAIPIHKSFLRDIDEL